MTSPQQDQPGAAGTAPIKPLTLPDQETVQLAGAVPSATSNGTAPAIDSNPHHLLEASNGLLSVSSASSLGAGAGGSIVSATASGSATSSSARNRTLYLGNLHPFVTEVHLREVFAGLGGITELKVIKDKATGVSAGYGFAKFTDQPFAQTALDAVNKTMLYGTEMRINWAFLKEQQEELGNHVHVFVGDLAPDVTDAMLLGAFQACRGCTDARVQWDHATGRSRGYGFVSFVSVEEAEAAIASMHGQFVGPRRVRCGWAQHKTDTPLPMEPSAIDRTDPTNTNVYVGNLSTALTDAEVRRSFAAFGPLAEMKLHRKGAFGFVRYKMHEDAVRAILAMNGVMLGGKAVKCSWGRHPNSPPSGMQTSLMLAAAAGIGPLAVQQGGGGGGLMPPQMGNFMAGSVMGMPMASAGGAGVLQQGVQMQGGGQDGLGGVMPLEHLYAGGNGVYSAGNGAYAMPTYGGMGQMFFPGQQSQ